MHLQDRGGRVLQGGLVVADTGAVRRSDLDQSGAGGTHDVGDAELATDLDQLAARDEHFLALGEHGQGEHQRRRTVVHDERGLGIGDRAQEKLTAPPAGPTIAGGAVDLEVGVVGGRPADGMDGTFGQRRAAEVRVQDHARGVDHARLAVGRPCRPGHGQGEDLVGDRRFLALCGALPDGLELGGQRALEDRAADDPRGALARRRPEDRVDRGHLAARVGPSHGSKSTAVGLSP